MDKPKALTAFAALSQDTRLETLRLLVRAREGLLSGEIATELDTRANTMSANLAVLANAGLVTATREGRNIRYRADFDGLRQVLAYLLQDCCGGRPDQCAALINGLLPGVEAPQ